MLEPGELLSTMDAKVWADEFMETKARLGEKEFDHAMMLGWFANAIMAGFDEATRRQQATIADLQGQLKAAKAPRMYDCGSCAIGKGFEQRVAQLEGEKQEYMQAATNEPLNEPLTYGALKAARFVAKRAFQELVKARADHATIADLQGQVKLANIDQANVEAERNDLQQRVAQLEGELERMKAIKHDDNTQMERAESDKWDAKDHDSTLMQRAIYAEGRVRALLKDGDDKDARIKALIIDNDNYRRKYHALQADHARVLGLLAQVTEIADMMLKGTECEHDVGLCSCEHRRIVKQAQRSLPAQPAQGGASKPVTTCNRHSDCDAADEKARAKGALHADHCHDDCCSECFGN